MGFWRHRATEPLGETHFQWANRASRLADPFFWLAFLPLVAVLAFLVYGVRTYQPPKGVTVLLLLMAGVAAIQFVQHWLLHYENFSITDKGLVRAFPEREHLGPIRLMKPLQWMWGRLRYVRWADLDSVQAGGSWVRLQRKDGKSTRIKLRPLRLVDKNRSVGVALKRHGPRGGGISESVACSMIAKQLQLAHKKWGSPRALEEVSQPV